MSPQTPRRLHVLYVCSFLSTHSRAVVGYFARRREEFEVTVVSSDPAPPMEGVRLLAPEVGRAEGWALLSWLARLWMQRLPLPEWLVLRLADVRLRREAATLRQRLLEATFDRPPDLVHALRIQPEGLAAVAVKERWPGVPFALWIWGLDLMLIAEASGRMRRETASVVGRANLLLPDNERDGRLARERFGLRPGTRVAVLPVTGGLEPSELDGDRVDGSSPLSGEPILLCMRGYENAYVRIHVLVEAMAVFRKRHPGARLVLLAAADFTDSERDRVIEHWAEELGVGDAVQILHPERRSLFRLLREADLYVSATRADGMPISLLEALYFGMVPVVFAHESTRALLQAADGVSFDRIDAATVAAAWERAAGQIGNRAERVRRNRELLAGGYMRAQNLEALARLYRETVESSTA